jgi:hypothetical protein
LLKACATIALRTKKHFLIIFLRLGYYEGKKNNKRDWVKRMLGSLGWVFRDGESWMRRYVNGF